MPSGTHGSKRQQGHRSEGLITVLISRLNPGQTRALSRRGHTTLLCSILILDTIYLAGEINSFLIHYRLMRVLLRLQIREQPSPPRTTPENLHEHSAVKRRGELPRLLKHVPCLVTPTRKGKDGKVGNLTDASAS